MVSRRTLETIMRAHDRREQQLLAIIGELNDRLMFMVGRTWAPPPADTAVAFDDVWPPDEDEDSDVVTDGEQLIA